MTEKHKPVTLHAKFLKVSQSKLPRKITLPKSEESSITYLEIIKKYLEPFIADKYPSGGYVFWPDLAFSHYANLVQKHLKNKNILFVPKLDNPENLPQVRTIERFWGTLKTKVYERNWSAKNLHQLQNRIKLCLRKIDLHLVQVHAEGAKKELAKYAQER